MSETKGQQEESYVLQLYVTGMARSSVLAIENIKSICNEFLGDNYTLEIIDIYKNPDVLEQEDIIACPTLIKKSPAPPRRFIGDLSDTSKVLTGLGINKELISESERRRESQKRD
jgi:circadian clock protein KaiB